MRCAYRFGMGGNIISKNDGGDDGGVADWERTEQEEPGRNDGICTATSASIQYSASVNEHLPYSTALISHPTCLYKHPPLRSFHIEDPTKTTAQTLQSHIQATHSVLTQNTTKPSNEPETWA